MAKHDPDLSLLFHALADPTRRSILTRLAEGRRPVTELARSHRAAPADGHAAPFGAGGGGADQPRRKTAGCAPVPSCPRALAPMRTWLDEQRAIWEARLDRLDDYVMNLMKEREQ